MAGREPSLRVYGRVFLRGFALVALVALNTRQIAAGNYPGAFMVGGTISAVWWANSSKDREDVPCAWFAYALGASFGTITGMYLGR